MDKSIRLNINESSYLGSLKNTFTKKFTTISELLQNSRRSGATLIKVTLVPNEKVIVIEDNGSGISDFSNLFTVGNSGWKDSDIGKENPYGVGFISTLFLARVITIASGGKVVRQTTKSILNQEPILIRDNVSNSPKKGTKITLKGGGIDADFIFGFFNEIQSIAKGFPIDIIYKNTEFIIPPELLHSPHRAIDTNTLEGVGEIIKDDLVTLAPILYLNGVRVSSNPTMHMRESNLNVIHLDPQEFQARMPDRDILIEESAEITKIITKLAGYHNENFLRAVKVSQPHLVQGVVNDYFRKLPRLPILDINPDSEEGRLVLHEALNKVDNLPTLLVNKPVDYSGINDFTNLAIGRDFTKDNIGNSQIYVVDTTHNSQEYGYSLDTCNTSIALRFICNNKESFLADEFHTKHHLHKDHWFHKSIVYVDPDNLEEHFTLDHGKVLKEAVHDTSQILYDIKFQLVEKIEITNVITGEKVSSEDTPSLTNVVSPDNVFLFTSGLNDLDSNEIGKLLWTICDMETLLYSSDNPLSEEDIILEMALFHAAIQSFNSNKEKQLELILNSSFVKGLQFAKGSTFEVTWPKGWDGNITVKGAK